MNFKKLVLSVLFFLPLSLQAATLDFTGISGNQGNTLALSNATINHPTGNILAGTGAASQVDGFCFLGSGCAADGEIIFNNAIENLFFDVDGAQNGDSVLISAFDNSNALLGSILATSNGRLDFSAFGSITRLFFDDSSTSAGVGYSTFSFDYSNNLSPVPVPAAAWLFGSALLGFAGYRRKKLKAA